MELQGQAEQRLMGTHLLCSAAKVDGSQWGEEMKGSMLGDGVEGCREEKGVRTLGPVHVVRAQCWGVGYLSPSA